MNQLPKKLSLRKAINAHCKSCVYDQLAAGSWKAQVTLCSVYKCELFDVRPTTQRIPESVFDYYMVPEAERSRLRLKKTPEGRFSEQTSETDGLGVRSDMRIQESVSIQDDSNE